MASVLLQSSVGLDGSCSAATGTHGERRVDERGVAIRCKACGLRVTTHEHRIEKAGAHRHTQMNPAGVFFTVVCFSWATGLTPYGEPSSEWSWFEGYAWTVLTCTRCLEHLGWRFSAVEGAPSDGFFGLIEAQLREGDDAR